MSQGPGQNATLTARSISGIAQRLYPDGPPLRRLLNQYRPFICPFEEVIKDVPRGSAVLDVGCGSGLLLGLLADQDPGLRATGFDVNEAAIEDARAMAARRQATDRLTFVQCDAGSAWPEGRFDVVTMIDVMHHVPPSAQRSIIETVAQTLGAGGLFLYKDMALRPRWMALSNRLHDLVLAQQWIHYVPVGDVARWAGEAGFVVEQQWAARRLWYSHEGLVLRKAH